MWTLRALNTDWAWPGHQDQISAALSVTHSLYVSLWLSLTTISKIIKPVACQYYQSFIINDKYRVFIICGTYLQCILQCMNPGEWCQYVETGQLITHMRLDLCPDFVGHQSNTRHLCCWHQIMRIYSSTTTLSIRDYQCCSSVSHSNSWDSQTTISTKHYMSLDCQSQCEGGNFTTLPSEQNCCWKHEDNGNQGS